MTDVLQHLRRVELQSVVEQIIMYELLNAPINLLRAHLQLSFLQPSTLDLSSVESSGDSDACCACMKLLVGEAALLPFDSVRRSELFGKTRWRGKQILQRLQAC